MRITEARFSKNVIEADTCRKTPIKQVIQISSKET